MVGILLSFPFGKTYFQGRTVSFREGIWRIFCCQDVENESICKLCKWRMKMYKIVVCFGLSWWMVELSCLRLLFQPQKNRDFHHDHTGSCVFFAKSHFCGGPNKKTRITEGSWLNVWPYFEWWSNLTTPLKTLKINRWKMKINAAYFQGLS